MELRVSNMQQKQNPSDHFITSIIVYAEMIFWIQETIQKQKGRKLYEKENYVTDYACMYCCKPGGMYHGGYRQSRQVQINTIIS